MVTLRNLRRAENGEGDGKPLINPLVTNGISQSYQLDESTFVLRGIRSNFSCFFFFSMKIMSEKRIALDRTPLFAASRLGLFSLPMSHKKDVRRIWVKLTLLVKLSVS